MEKPYNYGMSTIPGVKTLNPQRNGMLWNLIFHYAVNKLGRYDRETLVSRENSTKELYWPIFKSKKM